uniref:Uncharacterized protein n=1 Tax=Arundo donax TaxID=35708 RepID=A0A0A9B0K8_ARUDO
MPIKIRYAGIT